MAAISRSVGKPTKDRRVAQRILARRMLGSALGFSACDGSTLDDLVEGGHLRTLGKGEFLVHRGESFDMMSLVIEGRLDVSILSRDGHRHLVHVLQPGELASIGCVCGGRTHFSDLIAREPQTAVLVVSTKVLNELRETDQFLGRAFERQLAFRNRLLYERLAADTSVTLPTRLARILVTLSSLYGREQPEGRQLSFKTSQADFADMLGVSRQTVNLALQQFKSEGLILVNYSAITIVDLPRLRAHANL